MWQLLFIIWSCLEFSTLVYLFVPKCCDGSSKDILAPPIIFIIFWDFLMFYQIFLSLQVKQSAIISNKQFVFASFASCRRKWLLLAACCLYGPPHLTNLIFDFTFYDCITFFFRNVFYKNAKSLIKHAFLLI